MRIHRNYYFISNPILSGKTLDIRQGQLLSLLQIITILVILDKAIRQEGKKSHDLTTPSPVQINYRALLDNGHLLIGPLLSIYPRVGP